MAGDTGIFDFGGYTFFEKQCYVFKGQGWVTMIFLARERLELYVKTSFFFSFFFYMSSIPVKLLEFIIAPFLQL